MEKEEINLAVEICEGNPGAATVLRELQWFSRWNKMLRYFKETGLTGSALWARCKDDYHLDFHAFGHAIDEEMDRFYGEKSKGGNEILPVDKF